MKNVFLIVLVLMALSCDDGSPEAFVPTEKVISSSIINLPEEGFVIGDTVKVNSSIRLEVEESENVKIYFDEESINLFFNGVEYNREDIIQVDTPADFTLEFVPNLDENGELFKEYKATITVPKENSADYYSASDIKFDLKK